ncbi:MAG: tRNA (adenosine(37)-N6)-dimethylallyltransferase MiaA [Methylobacteriaceae bacterium]|nr:tRNA (adenosine(37)-N6)-dimethylallyltransferase MiaA [Methylobacteriaceae bacterium]
MRLLIAGPTASGKTALAIDVARRLGGVVVNGDSMQVYRDLSILTARPTPEEQAGVEHLMFGTVDAAENFSVGRWLAGVAAILAEETRPLIFCGGTGLYFSALTQGVSDIPAVPEAVRAQIRAELAGLAPHQMWARLKAADPATAARLRPSDPQRVTRALEVFAATGRSLAGFQDARQAPLLAPGTWRGVFLAVEREALYRRIDARFSAMIDAGALEEVRALAARGLDPALPAMRAHGVPGLIAHLAGETTLDEAIARGQADTRRYVKRQFTWARHQLKGFGWAPDAGAARAALLG